MSKSSKSRGQGHHPAVKPAFKPAGPRQTCWGGDGTVVCADSVRVLLPYEMTYLQATTLGSVGLQQFRGNSCFDPDLTGTGLQPTGFDQWAAFFNEYTVVSSYIEIENITGTISTTEIVVYPSYNASAPTSSEDASARPYAKRAIGNPNGNGIKNRLSQSMSTAQMMGVRDEAVLDDDQYGATTSANPGSAAVWYWNIVHQNLTSTSTLAETCRVRIVYDVLFHDRIQLSLSRVPARRQVGDAASAAQSDAPPRREAALELIEAALRQLSASKLSSPPSLGGP